MAERVRKMLGAVKQENVNSHGLGIVVKDPNSGKKINHVMIPRNTRLPVEVRQTFQTVSESQHRVTVQVMEGDAPEPEACSLLGKCRIADLPPGLPKGSPVEVSYAFNTSGRIGHPRPRQDARQRSQHRDRAQGGALGRPGRRVRQTRRGVQGGVGWPKQLDVYRDWLGITDSARPFNHYQLLKLKTFEDDPEKIRANYRKLNAHVRKFSTGEFGPQSQALLNELAKAMLCLTDNERKAEYDAVLGRTTTQPGKRRTMEQILLAARAITPEQLAKARDFAKAVGMEVRDAILQQRSAAPEVVMQAYAESVGRPYLDLADIELDPDARG